TMFMTFLAAFQILLSRYSGQQDIVVGTTDTGRHNREVENLIGLFLNTLVMRLDLSGNPSVGEVLRRAGAMARGAFDHQDVPFEKVVEELQPARTLSHNPLFNVMFDLQSLLKGSGKVKGMAIEAIGMDAGRVKFDLSLSIHERTEGADGVLRYQTRLYEKGTIRRLLASYKAILEQMANSSGITIGELSILSEADRRQLLVERNRTQAEHEKGKCIQQLFEEQVERTPDATAASNEDRQLTYRELNNRANQLGHYLQSLGVGPEARVGVCLERNLEMVIALLAVLKAGGSYVPL